MYSKYFNKDLLAKLREQVKEVEFPSVYEPAKWQDVKETSNCLQYALNLKGIKLERYLTVGAILGLNTLAVYQERRFEEILMEELEEMGFNVKVWQGSMDRNHHSKRQKIALFLAKECRQWHFMRQDADGNWSHQMGIGGRIERLHDLPMGIMCGGLKVYLHRIYSLKVE